MTDLIDAIAAKLIDAAYDVYGRPPEKGGIYVAKVLQQQDVPAPAEGRACAGASFA
jgi:hypothetical protein